ncbi:hypothetical protein [Saccharopolyspora shandongensis]
MPAKDATRDDSDTTTETRSQFWLSLVTLAVVLVGYEIRRRKGAPQPG